LGGAGRPARVGTENLGGPEEKKKKGGGQRFVSSRI